MGQKYRNCIGAQRELSRVLRNGEQPVERTSKPAIVCAEWSPSSDDIAVCSGHNLRLWSHSADTYEKVYDFQKDTAHAQWSPNGRWLAAWDAAEQATGQTFILWDSVTKRTSITASATYTDRLAALAWSPDGQALVTALASGTLEIHVLEPENNPLRILKPTPGGDAIADILFIDRARFITWGRGDVARLWSLDGHQLRQYGAVTDSLQVVQLAPGHGQLLGLFRDGHALLWDVETGAQLASFIGHSGPILAVDWRHNFLATGSIDGTVRVWDVEKCASGCNPLLVLRGFIHSSMPGRADVLGVHWLDDKQLLTWSEDGALRIWQVFDESGQPICNGEDLDDFPRCSGFSRTFMPTVISGTVPAILSARWLDADTIITTDNDGAATRYSLSSGTTVTWKDKSGDRPAVLWDPEGQHIFVYVGYPTEAGSGSVWKLGAGQPLATVPGPIACAYWLDVGLLISEANGALRLVAPDSGLTKVEFRGATRRVTSAQTHRNGRLATGEADGTVRVWDTQTGEQLAKFGLDVSQQNNAAVTELQWSEDGKHLLTANGRIALWNVENQQEIWASDETASTTHVAFSPDEALVAAAFADDFYVYDAATGAVRWHNRAHKERLQGIQWLTGGRWPDQDRSGALLGNLARWSSGGPWRADGDRLLLLTWSGDGTTRLWDWETQYEIARLAQPDTVRVTALSDDGTRIVTAGDGGVLRLWETWQRQPGSMLKVAQDRVTRPLSDEQLQEFSLQP